MSSRGNADEYDDAALARALQEEYEREYRRRSLQQHLGGRESRRPAPSAPPMSAYDSSPFYQSNAATAADPIPPSTRNQFEENFDDLNRCIEFTDEAYARRIEQEMVEEQMQNRVRRSGVSREPRRASTRATTAGQNYAHGTPNVVAPTNVEAPHAAVTGFQLSDEELAMRVEQELRDEELARTWAAQEQIRRSQVAARAVEGRRKCGVCCAFRRLLTVFLSVALVVVAVVLVVYFLGGSEAVGDFIPDPQRFREEDPFNSANPEDANLWRTRGNGLELTIINAVDESWNDYFYTAVDQWDSGTPDTLTLQTVVSEPESVCDSVDGKLKVCNGNYGPTDWRGINKVLLVDGWITSSSARMNDYYAQSNDRAQRQYTMCHEIGHGFGLPHTDEDFFNRDLFNCMDYTNNPENNMQPAEPNFKFLETLYGLVDGATSAASEAREEVPPGNRQLERGFPPAIAEALDEIDTLVDSGRTGSGWRKLHESEYGRAHEIDLGDGYTVQLHLLKA